MWDVPGPALTLPVTFRWRQRWRRSGDQPHAIAAGASDRYPLVAAPADSPHPRVAAIQPSSVDAGADAFTLTVKGTNFTRGSRVLWKGAARPTTFVSSTVLTAQIPGSDVNVPAKIPVSVVTPSPGGGSSEPISFTIAGASRRRAVRR